MSDFGVTTKNVIDSPWLETKCVAVGPVPPTGGTPDLYVLIEDSGRPCLRVDLYDGEEQACCFEEAIIWKTWAAVGRGNRVHLISTASGAARSIELGDYFGHFYPHDDFLLAAFGSGLMKINADG